jgi:hypothetical protein
VNADRGVADDQVRAFLAETLDLWHVRAVVESGAPRSTAVIRAENGTVVWIERPGEPGVPFRWHVRWRRAGDLRGGREHHPKACASIVGVLAALRTAFGLERGQALRIAAAPAVN